MNPVTRRFRIELAYDGTDFSGWQVQRPGVRTVQGVLEAALTRLQGGVPVRVAGAGRTDAGVHARRQVASCELESSLDEAGLAHALRRMLPADLRPVALCEAPASFDPQRGAVNKIYRYRLDRTVAGDPFVARYALHHPHPLRLDEVRQALETLLGRRDWSGFAGSACTVKDRVRELRRAEYEEVEDGTVGWFTFAADGFLNHMVRILVGTLLEVGRDRFPLSRIEQVLAEKDRTLAGPTAAARGLVLWQVDYR